MRFFEKVKDGGPDSPVDAYVLIEIKSLFSIMLLKFNPGMREAFHSHAFNAFSIFLSGDTDEERLEENEWGFFVVAKLFHGGMMKYTPRSLIHRFNTYKPAWVLTFRGPWRKQWTEAELLADGNWMITTLQSPGRQVVSEHLA